MRRRSQVFLLVIGAAAALLLSAAALGAGVLTTEQAVITGGGSQQNPAIAVDPDSPLRAAVVAEDSSVVGPFPRTATASAIDWSGALWPAAALPHPGQSLSAGQPDITWGIDNPNSGSGPGGENVYLVEEASTSNSICTPGNDGVFFSSSDDGGAHWDTALPVTSGASNSETIEPTIAVDRSSGRLYVAYTKVTFADANCSGGPVDSEIFLIYANRPNNGNPPSWLPLRRVSPLATSGSAHYRSPSLAVLPDGRVIVAFRNDANAQVETETCTFLPTPPASNYCGAPTAGLVGASTVVGNVGGSGLPAPSVVAAGGRVTVAWSAPSGDAVRTFAAMSTDGGTTFGSAQQIDPDGGGNQFNPRLAATADGRVDAAYLWDPAGTGVVNATTASAAAPLPGATTEAWGNPVTVQAVGTPTAAGIGRLGVATANAISPLPATVVAFTDSSSGSQDVHVVGLLHGTTAPVIDASATRTLGKNVPTIVTVKAIDADGDPLTWSVGGQPDDPGSSVSVENPARGDFTFKAANNVRSDSFEAIATDGVPGHEVQATINVNVVNDPPKVTCTLLVVTKDQPRPIPVSECVSDPNHDPVTMDLDGATGGSVERVAGVWRFVPTTGSTTSGSVVIHASDPTVTIPGVRVPITIITPPGSSTLDVPEAGKTYTVAVGAAVRMAGTAVDAEGKSVLPLWTFSDTKTSATGTRVAHRFRRPGTFTVMATAGDKTAKMKAVVLRRAVEVVGAPKVVDGVLQVTVRTRAAGLLLLKADSRSQTIRVPAGLTRQTLRIQVTTGPLVRLTLRITPNKKTPTLKVLTIRRLVMVSPVSVG
jgi:hypothetical protein